MAMHTTTQPNPSRSPRRTKTEPMRSAPRGGSAGSGLNTVLPPERHLATAINQALAAQGRVHRSDLRDFYDGVLEALGVVVPDALYAQAVARLHTVACTACPHIRWVSHRRAPNQAGFVWVGALSGGSASDDDT